MSRAPADLKGTKMTKKQLAPAEISAFCTHVSLMLSSGLPIYSGMEALAESAQKGAEAELCAELCAGVQESGSLYQALKRDARWPKYMVEMTGVGERAGCLEAVMDGLAAYYDRESRIRAAIRNAVTYPIVLGVMMLAIILILIFKVMPVFRRVLGGMGVAMGEYGDWMTRAGAGISWFVLALVGAAMLITLLCALLMHTGARDKTLRLLNRCFPALRRLNRRLSAARMANVLSMLLSGGFPMEEALEMVPAVMGDEAASEEVKNLQSRMQAGVSFDEALESGRLFDPLHRRMIRMGAAVGREDQVMENIAHSYEEDVEEGVGRLVSVIEPALVAALCVVIGAILLSVMLPMAGMISSII